MTIIEESMFSTDLVEESVTEDDKELSPNCAPPPANKIRMETNPVDILRHIAPLIVIPLFSQ